MTEGTTAGAEAAGMTSGIADVTVVLTDVAGKLHSMITLFALSASFLTYALQLGPAVSRHCFADLAWALVGMQPPGNQHGASTVHHAQHSLKCIHA